MQSSSWFELVRTVLASSVFLGGFWFFLFAVVFVVIFRKPIAAFIGRMTRFGRGPWSAEAPAPQEQKVPPAPPAIGETLGEPSGRKADPRTAADELLAPLGRNEYISFREELIKKTLAERGLQPGDPETHRVLTTFLATTVVSLEFEQIYNSIWTSQILLLRDLNTKESAKAEELRHHYDVAARLSPEIYTKYPFEQYLRFLGPPAGLIAEIAPNKYAIMEKGRTFLLYLTHQRKPDIRPVY